MLFRSLGKVFSLLNAAVSTSDKLRWVELYELSEIKKLDAFIELPQTSKYFGKEEAERFKELLHRKCTWWSLHLDDNSVWDWQVSTNVMVCGTSE